MLEGRSATTVLRFVAEVLLVVLRHTGKGIGVQKRHLFAHLCLGLVQFILLQRRSRSVFPSFPIRISGPARRRIGPSGPQAAHELLHSVGQYDCIRSGFESPTSVEFPHDCDGIGQVAVGKLFITLRNPGMFQELLGCPTLSLVDTEHHLYQINRLRRCVAPIVLVEMIPAFFNLFEQTFLVFVVERWVTSQQYITNDTHAPNIHFFSIFITAQDFRCHIARCSTRCLFRQQILNSLRKTKIGYFYIRIVGFRTQQ
mmetsp:Transcript_1485/g.2444  ORF Transcript_1485/g.2444 Transcript_1485/m.2444 type:complete len:256 (+) Transcript_1485:371-1138(+)